MLFSVHLKTTMMRVSDPIIFGHAVRAYFADVFEEHGEALKSAGVNPNDGLGALLKAIESLPDEQREAIEQAIEAAYESGPPLAMVDSARGITNLHVPSDVIIDASMPAAIRSSGQMWNADGEQQDAKFVIPDHSYAALYAETVEDCRRHGAFDPATMGTHAEHRADGPGGRGVRVARQDVRDRGNRVCAGRTHRRRRDAARARGLRRRHLADVPDQGRPDPGLGAAGGLARAGNGYAGRVLARRDARPRRRGAAQGSGRRSTSSTPTASRSRSSTSPQAAQVHARARPRRQGHDLGHRQRAPRLPHRPVPDPRARHQRQDAVDRAADAGRRPVRDGRGRIGAPARPAVPRGEPSALGLARGVPRARPVARAARRTGRQPAREAAGRHARPRDRAAARGGPLAVARRSASSTTAALTSTSRCTGPGSWPTRTTTPSWPSGSSRWPTGSPRASRRSSRS